MKRLPPRSNRIIVLINRISMSSPRGNKIRRNRQRPLSNLTSKPLIPNGNNQVRNRPKEVSNNSRDKPEKRQSARSSNRPAKSNRANSPPERKLPARYLTSSFPRNNPLENDPPANNHRMTPHPGSLLAQNRPPPLSRKRNPAKVRNPKRLPSLIRRIPKKTYSIPTPPSKAKISNRRMRLAKSNLHPTSRCLRSMKK